MQRVPAGEPVFLFSYAMGQARWNRILDALGPGLKESFPPSSLRGGGTVWLYKQTGDIPLVLWRGRWTSDRTLKYYLQESLSNSAVRRLGRKTQEQLKLLSSAYDVLFFE